MRRAWHMGIVLAVTAHMLCGCCLHHAHLYDGPCDHPHRGKAEGGWPDGHHDPDGQDEGRRCVFIRRHAPGLAELLAGPDHDGLPVGAAAGPGGRYVADVSTAGLRRPTPPVPLHLLNQAFLL